MTSTATLPTITVGELTGSVRSVAANLQLGAHTATYVHADGETWSGELVVVSETFAHFAPAERTATGAGYCQGCGETFTGARGLKSHQSRPFVSMGCRA